MGYSRNKSGQLQEIKFLLKEKYGLTDLEILNKKHLDVDFKHSKEIIKDITLLNKGYPLAYIVGFSEFLGCKIDLSLKPLIPRPETEYWVETSINSLKKIVNQLVNYQVLDLYCGSGCIGIAILKELAINNKLNMIVTFADIDVKMLEQTLINLKINKIPSKYYKIIKSNNFSNLKEQKFDYIFANPPYVSDQIKNTNLTKTIKYEPSKALYTKNDGLEIINKFLKSGKDHVKNKIYMEFGYGQKLKIEKILKQYKYSNYEFIKDQYNKYRELKITHFES